MSRAFFGKVEQWALAAYLPTEANREADDFLQGWSALMHRAAQEAETVIFGPATVLYPINSNS